MSGSIEALTVQITQLNSNIEKLLVNDGLSAVAGAEDGASDTKKASSKKAASKKTASKKASSKRTKTSDLSDMTEFKRRFFAIADASGVKNVLPKLKKFIKSEGYGSSDEIEVDDREDFLEKVKEHFAELADDEEESDDPADIDV